jgi:hypothetical protein
MYTSLASRVTAAEASVDAVAPDTGIVLTLEYASLPVGYEDYADVAASVPNYSALSSSAILATSEAIAAFLVEAEAAQALAESWASAVADLVALYPHPFVFVGAG